MGDNENGDSLKGGARELYVWSHVHHRNILELLGYAMFRDQISMISPWMDNGTLSDFVDRSPSVNRHVLCVDISEGVAYLHQSAIVHGNIKSSNILVSQEGIPKLVDFGNSWLPSPMLRSEARSGNSRVSLRWTAPEMLLQEDAVCSKETDVYALGMTLLEVVTGEVPFVNKSEMQVLVEVGIRQGHPERPTNIQSFNEDEANRLWELMVYTWSFDPSDRPTSTTVRDCLKSIKPSPLEFVAPDASTGAPNEKWMSMHGVAAAPNPVVEQDYRDIGSPQYAESLVSNSLFGLGSVEGQAPEKTSRFTRRLGVHIFPQPTPTNGYSSMVDSWHKTAYDHQDVIYHFERVGRISTLWQATPMIFGEVHPQYRGLGSSKSQAREASAEKIAMSGHC